METRRFTKHRRIALGMFGAAAMVSMSSGMALAEATGDGWMGPKVVTSAVLNESLHALNHHIQDKYAQDDIIAALTQPREPDFAVAAAASAAAPTIEQTQEAGAFGYTIFNSQSLDTGLELFNTELTLRGDDPFIQVAPEANSKGDAFALAASSAGLDEKMVQRRLALAEAAEGVGDAVRDGASLEASVVALNRRMNEQVEREIMLAAAVPPVNGLSFTSVMVAMAISY